MSLSILALGRRTDAAARVASYVPSTPFPVLDDATDFEWEWPAPPFEWQYLEGPGMNTSQPCELQLRSGGVACGTLKRFDTVRGALRFQETRAFNTVTVPFDQCMTVTLTLPLRPEPPILGVRFSAERLRPRHREHVVNRGNGTTQTIVGTGWVERQEGLYVFARGARDDGTLLRMFLPRSSYLSCETGLPVNATSAAPWISSPGQLDEVLRRRWHECHELRLGEALLELGMLNTDQLQCALARQSANRPLGLLLEMAGAVSRADVQTALAHKAGYPLVDLARYPIDWGLAPGVDMRATRGIPLMLHRDRLVVAVDKLSNVAGLRSLRADLGLDIVPAFAPLGQVARVLERMG